MEFLYDCAEALREEYKAIVDAGFVLQLDRADDRFRRPIVHDG